MFLYLNPESWVVRSDVWCVKKACCTELVVKGSEWLWHFAASFPTGKSFLTHVCVCHLIYLMTHHLPFSPACLHIVIPFLICIFPPPHRDTPKSFCMFFFLLTNFFFSHILMHYCVRHICECVFIYVCVGGEGKVGKVVDIRGWDTESGRSVASVTWSNGTTNVYRMGHKGKVDLKYVCDGQGGFYYKDHLPKLGKTDSCFHILHSINTKLNAGYIAQSVITVLRYGWCQPFNSSLHLNNFCLMW